LQFALQNDFGIVVHPDVRKALRERQAVVALESTIISHGMPYPQNLRTALEVEDIVREGVLTCWAALLA
jgi:pseudouridine-5'-phosphate glycosidase